MKSLIRWTLLIFVAVLAFIWYKGHAARVDIESISPRIGTIDFYGLHTVTATQLRANLNIREGDTAPVRLGPGVMNSVRRTAWRLFGGSEIDTDHAEKRLERIPGVVRARVSVVRNSGNARASLFVGIEEKNAPCFGYLPVPTGAVALPPQIFQTYDQMTKVMMNALANDADEDDSQGYALIKDPVMLPLEQKMIAYAASDTATVRDVLKNSADASQRDAAAWIIAYAPDKRAILGDLMNAVRDPDDRMRNNATRAIAVLGEFANDRPELGIHIDPSPFIDMLNSLIWTDRNKATAVLLALTEKRAPEILKELRARAVPALTEMAGWKDVHSEDAKQLLERISTANTNSSASDSHPGH